MKRTPATQPCVRTSCHQYLSYVEVCLEILDLFLYVHANDPYDPYEKETLFSFHIRYLVSVTFGSHNRLEAWASFRKIQKISPKNVLNCVA